MITIYAVTQFVNPAYGIAQVIHVYDIHTDVHHIALVTAFKHHKAKHPKRDFQLTFTPPNIPNLASPIPPPASQPKPLPYH